MVLDISEAAPDHIFTADVCIIGSGAAGITVAREFIGSAYSVLLLEGGGNLFEPPSQDPYQSEIVGLPHGGIHEGRVRVLGGTTTWWAGQILPLFDIDFEKRDWVAHSGWPIAKQDLRSYYLRAEEVMQAPHATYEPETWPRSGISPPTYDNSKLIAFYSQFARVPDFAKKYRDDLQAAANITVLTHANVVSLEANEGASALREARVRSFQQQNARVQARFFIVCCGGIDTPRLLLASSSVEPNGIGNEQDVVGRFFQDHPGINLPVRLHDPKRFSGWYNSFRKEGIRYVLKVGASAELQRQHRILNTGAEVYYPAPEDDPIGAAKQVLKALRDPAQRSQAPQALAAVVRQPGKVMVAAYRYYLLRQPASVGSGQPHLGMGCEQEPNPASRVTLSRETDSLGMRRTVLDWRLTGSEVRSIEVFAQAVAEEWQRLGVAELDLSNFDLSGREHHGFMDANHHIGTTRMGTDRKTSVVDSHCRVHGYDNLYIGSSSVFPTGGYSNPTFTTLALCLRISDEIKTRLTRPAMVSTV